MFLVLLIAVCLSLSLSGRVRWENGTVSFTPLWAIAIVAFPGWVMDGIRRARESCALPPPAQVQQPPLITAPANGTPLAGQGVS